MSAGCTSLVGIDGDYVAVRATGGSGAEPNAGTGGEFSGAGGTDGAAGSTAAAGGVLGSGGSGGSVGTAGSSGTGGTGTIECGQGQKACDNECVTLSPAVGCASTSCAACPAPPEHAEVWCNPDQKCDVRCAPGYVPDAGRCVLEGTVGSGGSGGAGGTGATGGTGASGNGGRGGTGGTGNTGGTGGTGPCTQSTVSTCPRCTQLDGRIPCCSFSGRCGCGYPVVGAFYCI
jgi:hypothetical protein